MLDALFSAILQLIVFSLIPLLVYLIRYRKLKGFFNYIGLKPSTRKANLLSLWIVLLLGVPVISMTYLSSDFKAILTHPESVTGAMRAQGWSLSTVVIILVTAIIKTGLAEEIFFRGFVAKRLIAWLGYQTGNIAQAVIFGAIHGLLFMTITGNIIFLLVIFLFPTIAAYFKAYLNEKVAGGSILPGWIAHGLGNVLAYSFVAFLL